MVDQQAFDKVNEKLASSSLRIAVVAIEQCDLLEKNARFMRLEQYRKLVENIKRDGGLTSVPFAVRQGERYRILSGNHRVKAARDAGLTEVPLLFTDQALSRAEEVAIQLSHNAIAGQDDLAILRELYDEIDNVALKEYSGLDDDALGRMTPPSLDPLSEKGLEYRVVSVAFLPDEIERAQTIFSRVMEHCDGQEVWVNRFAEYDRFLDALTVGRETAGIKNTATALMLLLDVAERHLDEIPRPAPKAKR